jgi:hypothetical protein
VFCQSNMVRLRIAPTPYRFSKRCLRSWIGIPFSVITGRLTGTPMFERRVELSHSPHAEAVPGGLRRMEPPRILVSGCQSLGALFQWRIPINSTIFNRKHKAIDVTWLHRSARYVLLRQPRHCIVPSVSHQRDEHPPYYKTSRCEFFLSF